MSNDISVEVRGLVETQRKLEQVAEDVHSKPMVDAMRRATLIVTRDAKLNLSKPTTGVKFPTINSGQLRNSITPEIRNKHNILQGVVGSNLKHAPYMEFGTGIPAGRPRHIPPLAAIQKWVSQKNRGGKSLNAYVIQQAIARRGGLVPRRYLQRAFDKNKTEIQEIFDNTVKNIVSK